MMLSKKILVGGVIFAFAVQGNIFAQDLYDEHASEEYAPQVIQQNEVHEVHHEEPAPVAQPQQVAPVPVQQPAPVHQEPAATQHAPTQFADTTPHDVVPQDETPREPRERSQESWVREWWSGFEPVEMFEWGGVSLGAGITTVRTRDDDGAFKNETWSMITLGTEFSIWRFGVYFDFDFFFDEDFEFQDKGWDFSDGNAADAIFRKIRYIRFGQPRDPLYVRFGGLSNTTLGYGIMVDRFSNMVNYPTDKLLGLQLHINDFSPIGVSLQTMISDFAELSDGGGIIANRLSVMPLKTMDIPIVNRLAIGVSHATDRDPSQSNIFGDTLELYDRSRPNEIDTIKIPVGGAEDNIGMIGFDVGLPLIDTELLGLTVYTQFATRTGDIDGWGLALPGVAFNVWRLNAVVEYRFTEGRFAHGFFDRFYLDERLRYYPNNNDLTITMRDKGQYIDSVSTSGIYGRLGMDLFGILKLEGGLERMSGERFVRNEAGAIVAENILTRGYEATVSVGETVMTFVPVLDLAEVYIRNSNIGMAGNILYDEKVSINGDDAWLPNPEGKRAGAFDRSPFLFWGYRAGVGIGGGAMLVFDYRYGWRVANDGTLRTDNRLSLAAAVRY